MHNKVAFQELAQAVNIFEAGQHLSVVRREKHS